MSEVERRAVQQMNSLKSEYQMILERVSELEMEHEEHEVVVKALEPLDSDRRCHRLVGGVLVERNVAEVVPALRKNQTSVYFII